MIAEISRFTVFQKKRNGEQSCLQDSPVLCELLLKQEICPNLFEYIVITKMSGLFYGLHG